VIGGSFIFELALGEFREHTKLVFLTRINKAYECDVTMPELGDHFAHLFVSKTMSQDDITFDYVILGHKQVLEQSPDLVPTRVMEAWPAHQEYQYLDMIRECMDSGNVKNDRTKTGVRSKFGKQMRYDLSESFPVLTTKDVFWRGLAEELVWFIKGDTNSNHLKEKKIRIWDGNGSREFLDNLGFTDREEGDLGPVYGF
jgi:dihydrofolate reductase/thymidylate synthase